VQAQDAQRHDRVGQAPLEGEEGREQRDRRAAETERGMDSVEDEVLAALSPEERADLRRLLDRALEGEAAAAPVAAGER
jgi:hypothetical protein